MTCMTCMRQCQVGFVDLYLILQQFDCLALRPPSKSGPTDTMSLEEFRKQFDDTSDGEDVTGSIVSDSRT